MLLFNIVSMQFNTAFPWLYKSAEALSIEVFVGITQKLLDMLLDIFIILKLTASTETLRPFFVQMSIPIVIRCALCIVGHYYGAWPYPLLNDKQKSFSIPGQHRHKKVFPEPLSNRQKPTTSQRCSNQNARTCRQKELQSTTLCLEIESSACIKAPRG